MKITYKKGSLFEAPKGSYLVHACNTQGVWGSGIAVEFRKRCPHAHAVYSRNCQGSEEFLLGKSFAIRDKDWTVGCLLVSWGYGKDKSPEADILKYTEESLHNLLKYVQEWDKQVTTIYSNRFNSGFFAVPWVKTEKVLQKVLQEYNIDWVVMDPDLKE